MERRKRGFNLERMKKEKRKRYEGKGEEEQKRRGRGNRRKDKNIMSWRRNILAINSWLLTYENAKKKKKPKQSK